MPGQRRLRGGGRFFFPTRGGEVAMLEEGATDHSHEGVTMKTAPGLPLEVVEAEFLLELLIRLLADPARLDGCAERAMSCRHVT
jgi:hypothetical protein